MLRPKRFSVTVRALTATQTEAATDVDTTRGKQPNNIKNTAMKAIYFR